MRRPVRRKGNKNGKKGKKGKKFFFVFFVLLALFVSLFCLLRKPSQAHLQIENFLRAMIASSRESRLPQ
jgi:hypothetical protein